MTISRPLLRIPARDSLSVDTTDGGLLITQADGNGNEESIFLCLDDARALALAIHDWIAEVENANDRPTQPGNDVYCESAAPTCLRL